MEFIDLKKQYSILKEKIDKNILDVLDDGNYIMGREVKQLEEELANYVGRKYCITCANGTDALLVSLMALGVKKNDVVFVPDFTFFATAEVVSTIGAIPIFIDVDIDTFNIDTAKLEETIIKIKEEGRYNAKAIIPVDLFGLPADYKRIEEIAQKYNLIVIEDGAQGFGGSINEKKACSFGNVATTSFFPAKPLGCYGDGGAIFTDSKDIESIIRSLCVHGKGKEKYDNVRVGVNSRLDTIQAAVLLPKLEAFKDYELIARNEIAKKYNNKLSEIVNTPYIKKEYISSYAQYTIKLNSKEERDYLQQELKKIGIPTMIYYPKAIHKQTIYNDYDFNIDDLKVSGKLSDIVLSLPMHPYLEDDEIELICNKLIEILGVYRNEGK